MGEIHIQTYGYTSNTGGVSDSGIWGIIYCPKEGQSRRWNKIRNYLGEQGVQFDFVQSESPGSVERLAAMMTRSGYRTLIIVGGDAALNYALNGIMNTASPTGRRPALGVIPNGHGNDFAHYWGFQENDYKSTVLHLLKRRTRRIDIGVLHPSPAARTDEGISHLPVPDLYFLNCINIGTVASIINLRRKARFRFGLPAPVSHLTSAFLLLFQRLNFKIDFSLNGERFKRRAMMLCIGSAHGYGLTPSAVPYNGQLDLSMVSTPQLTQLFHGLWLLFTGRFLRHKDIRVWRTRHIDVHSVSGADISLDGRYLHQELDTFSIEIMPEEIEFLIP